MKRQLEGMTVAILVADGFEQAELTEPKQALEDAGAETRIVSPADEQVEGWKHFDSGDSFAVDVALDDADAQDFDAEWAKTVTAAPAAVKGKTATVALTFPKSKYFDQKVMSVSLVREAGAWKIDKVRGRYPKT